MLKIQNRWLDNYKSLNANGAMFLQGSVVLQCCDWPWKMSKQAKDRENGRTRFRRATAFSLLKYRSREREGESEMAVGSGGVSQCAREQLEIQVSICNRWTNPESRCSDKCYVRNAMWKEGGGRGGEKSPKENASWSTMEWSAVAHDESSLAARRAEC